MRTLVVLCLVALAMGQPVKEDIIGPDNHVQKREVVIDGEAEDDCSQLTGDAYAVCNEKRVKRDADMAGQNDDGQDVNGTAHQDSNIQEAWSNEGAYARQGEGGQFISASDFGGPIIQILQHVYKANCCECGCNCGCPGHEPTDSDSEDETSTGGD